MLNNRLFQAATTSTSPISPSCAGETVIIPSSSLKTDSEITINMTYSAYHLVIEHQKNSKAYYIAASKCLSESTSKKYIAFMKKITELLKASDKTYINNKPNFDDELFVEYEKRVCDIYKTVMKGHFDSVWPKYNSSLVRKDDSITWETATIFQYQKAQTYATSTHIVSGQLTLMGNPVSINTSAALTSSKKKRTLSSTNVAVGNGGSGRISSHDEA